MRPVKTQIIIGICPDWSAFVVRYSQRLIYVIMLTTKTDQSGQMPRPIRVLAGRTGHFVGFVIISSHLSPLTSEVVGAPQMTLQQYLSTLPCLPLPSGNLQTPFPSIPWCYLPISFSVFPSFLLLSLSLAELFSPCPRILRCGHTIWVSFFFTMVRSSCTPSCILDSVANLLVCHMVFVGNIQSLL